MYKIIKFGAPWCAQCKSLEKTIESYIKENPDANIVSINVDDDEEATEKYNIRNLPTVIISKDDMEVARKTGFMTLKQFKDFICDAEK